MTTIREKNRVNNCWPQYYLTDREWVEITTLDYCLTWRLGNYEADLKRYRELSAINYNQQYKTIEP